MKSYDLKNCPFCCATEESGTVLMNSDMCGTANPEGLSSYVYCRQCRTHGPIVADGMNQRQEAAELWNKRYTTVIENNDVSVNASMRTENVHLRNVLREMHVLQAGIKKELSNLEAKLQVNEILNGVPRKRSKVVFTVPDSSGTMSKEDLKAAMKEVESVMDVVEEAAGEDPEVVFLTDGYTKSEDDYVEPKPAPEAQPTPVEPSEAGVEYEEI
jgi:hypothetical protein